MKKRQVINPPEDIDCSIMSNISIVNPCNIDDSFTSHRNESNTSKLSNKSNN